MLISNRDRFWSKVAFSQSGCWKWLAGKQAPGYGRFYCDGKMMLAHRFAFADIRGPLPPFIYGECELDHLCREPACVRPDHLEIVTHQVNMLRSDVPSAIHARQTHCHKGHEFTSENIYLIPSTGSRQCRQCSKIYDNSENGKAIRKAYRNSARGKAKNKIYGKIFREKKKNHHGQ